MLGGICFGMLSDRLGRVRVLTWTIVLFAVFTGLCALAQGYWDLLVYRTIAGLGLGGEFGIGMALVAEAWPASKRARASSYVGARLAGRRARRRARDAAAAAVDRLARHVPRRPAARRSPPSSSAGSLHEPKIFVERAAKPPRDGAARLLVQDAATTR